MPSIKTYLSYSDYITGIQRLSIEEQLNLAEFIFASLRKRLNQKTVSISEDSLNDELNGFCGKWQDNRDADEIISQIYSDRAKNIRSEKAVL